jgi:hypothetical protein
MDRADNRATSQVVRDATTNLQGLVRAEVDLAKAEVLGGVKQAVGGIALLVIGGVTGLFVLAFGGVTVAKALEQSFAPWIAWLIVTGVVTLLMVVLALVGVRLLRTADTSPTVTTTSIQETVAWAKTQLQR